MSDNTKKIFSPRAFASVFAGLTFVFMAVTGLVLFFAPSCRIARDTNWTVLGHNKDQWSSVHIWLSIAFIIASFIHIYLNWTPLMNYFKSKVRKGWALRTEWITAFIVCIILYAGSAREVAPFSSLMIWKETFRHGAAEGGHGRRAVQMASQHERNQVVHTEQNLLNSGLNSKESHENCDQTEHGGHGSGRAGMGTGRKMLKQFCSDEGIELDWAITHLTRQGHKVRDTMTMREIADDLGVHPRELRSVLQPNQ